MSYSAKANKAFEQASKSSHSHIIKDESVVQFLETCNLPKDSEQVELDKELIVPVAITSNPIEFIIAIDGGCTTVPVKTTFPSSTITFFQFGALTFSLKDLEGIAQKPFVSPEDIAKLKELERTKFVLPTKNLSLKGESNLIYSARRTLYDFFCEDRGDGETFIKTLYWFIFKEYSSIVENYQLASCPSCGETKINLDRKKLDKLFQLPCPNCKENIFLTDVFRLHEAIDNELGAGGVIGYVLTLIEQVILIHTIRLILKIQPHLLSKILFIKDGPLAFFGQTANMHKPMRDLMNFLFEKHNIYLAGLEKSGAFVEHASEIVDKLDSGRVFLLNNTHIYKYILPGDPSTKEPYAATSYYGSKLFFKSIDDAMYVITIPTQNEQVVMNPRKEDFKNLDVIVHNIQKLKCDMYDSALLPVALANKLVSLSNHPSSVLLTKFAKEKIH